MESHAEKNNSENDAFFILCHIFLILTLNRIIYALLKISWQYKKLVVDFAWFNSSLWP